MCENSHSIAASASLLPVARSAFWQRNVGNPIPSSWAMAASLNWGKAVAAVSSSCPIRLAQKEGERARTWGVVGQFFFSWF